MTFAAEADYRQWLALVHDKQAQLARARQIAERVAFDDLPRNEKQRYLAWALQAIREEEKAS